MKSCKAISDDKERLKCFDGLFGEASKPEKSHEEKQANWSIEETKSPTDGSPEVVAANLVGDTILICDAKSKPPKLLFRRSTINSAIDPLNVQLRINDQSPTKEV